MSALLGMQGICKRFPGVVALNQVSFDISPGEIVALIGENGAGKSTLMKTLGGVHQPNEGKILVDGQAVTINSVADANALGIGFVHQELNNLDNLHVAANVFLGREPRRFGLIDREALAKKTVPYLQRLGLDIDPLTPLGQLSIGQQQLVEIAKALSMEARIVIMDEPTSSLTLTETETLLQVMRELRDQGIAIIFITHRLGEIEACADRVVALRDGENSGKLDREEINHDAMVRLMVGRDIKKQGHRDIGKQTADYFVVEDLRTTLYPDSKVSITVAGGEILGVAGLVGSGRSEVAQAIFGVDHALGGRMRLGGKDIPLNNTQAAVQHGIYLAPEDRKAFGLVLEMPVRENITLASLPDYTRLGLIKVEAEKEETQKQIASMKIKTPDGESAVMNLSGGNQQKVVLGKWLSMDPKVIIFDEPTRGIDVGAKSEIYMLMHELANRGVAVIAISSDMEEVLGISDRIAVMSHGGIAGFLGRDDASEEAVMQLAVHHQPKPMSL